KESDNHLKALYMWGHINGRPISCMLVDGGAIVNLMPFSLYKKLGGTDEELIKTNMTVSGVGGGDPIGAKGVASMELTVGSKTVATAFFVSEVQDNFNLILGRDWIHAKGCLDWIHTQDNPRSSSSDGVPPELEVLGLREVLCTQPV